MTAVSTILLLKVLESMAIVWEAEGEGDDAVDVLGPGLVDADIVREAEDEC